MKLYSYFRSSASFRVRIALALKGLDYDYAPVHLVQGRRPAVRRRIQGHEPGGAGAGAGRRRDVLTQSLAIIEYLEETRPEPPLLPGDAAGRARVRAIALSIACEIHPLNNLRVLGYLNKTLGVAEEQRNAWYRHWVETGLATVEAMLAGDPRTGSFCHGDAPTLADVLLVPQIFNAQRFDCRLDHVPTVMRIHRHCLTLPAFAESVPALQPDAE
jgi:maleylacetoacetate isomerase